MEEKIVRTLGLTSDDETRALLATILPDEEMAALVGKPLPPNAKALAAQIKLLSEDDKKVMKILRENGYTTHKVPQAGEKTTGSVN